MNFTWFLYYFTTALVAFFIYMLVKMIYFLMIMSKIPGPKTVPLFGNVLDFQKPPEIIFKLFERYGKEYHPIYRLSTFVVYICTVINSPEDIEVILSSSKHIQKSRLYEPFRMWLNNGLLMNTGDKWHTRRRVLTPTFHFNILQQFLYTFKQKGEKLVNEIQGLINKEVEIESLVSKYTFYTICETAMGTAVEENIEKYRKAVYKMGEITVHRITYPWYYPTFLYITSPKFFQAMFTARYLHKYSRDIIKKRKDNFNVNAITVTDDNVYKSKNRLAMLDMLLYSQKLGNDIDDEGVREEVDTFIFEGYDTTSSCLSFTMMLLACNKDIQDNVVKELDELLPKKNDRLTYDILNNMKYLERVIKESLRLYPSVPQFARYLNEAVKTHTGYVLLPGSDVMIRAYDIHRNPAIYPDPEKFDPDRFLPENVKNRHPYAYIPFSAGPRNCIGQKFALLELKTLLSSILRNFEILPIDTPNTITLITDLILHTKDGIRVKFTPRR